MIRRNAIAVLMAFSLTSPAWAGGGGMPVGATEVTQIANNAELVGLGIQQAEMIIQQVQTAQATLRSIESYGDMDWNSAQGALMDIFRATRQARGVSYQMQNLDEGFRQAYPTYRPQQNYSTAYQGWTDDTMEGLKSSLHAANIQSNQFNTENSAMNYLSGLSDNAQGQTQAIQAGNAISGQLVSQMQKMRQLQMAQMNAQNAFMAHQVNTEAASKAAFENSLNDYTPENSYAPLSTDF